MLDSKPWPILVWKQHMTSNGHQKWCMLKWWFREICEPKLYLYREKIQNTNTKSFEIITETIVWKLPCQIWAIQCDMVIFLIYFRTKNKIKEITLEQDFDHLEWSDVKKNISNRFRTDFYTGYRSAGFFLRLPELETTTIWRQFLIRMVWVSRFKALTLTTRWGAHFFFAHSSWKSS